MTQSSNSFTERDTCYSIAVMQKSKSLAISIQKLYMLNSNYVFDKAWWGEIRIQMGYFDFCGLLLSSFRAMSYVQHSNTLPFPFFLFLYSMFIFPFLHPFFPASQLIQSNGFESSNQISPDNMAMNSGKKPKLCSSIKGFKLPLKIFAMT